MATIEFQSAAPDIKKVVLSKEKVEKEQISLTKRNMLSTAKEGFKQLDALRQGGHESVPLDLSTDEFIKENWGFESLNSLLRFIGENPAKATISSFLAMPDFNEGYRWLVPEIFRTAIRAGMDVNPTYKELIASEQNITQPTITMPVINRSDAMVSKLGESQTIQTGQVSFGQKSVSTQKMGIGLKVTDEVLRFVPLNIMSIFFQDMGSKLDAGLTNLAVSTLINGDGNSNAIPVVGVNNTTSGVTYADMLRVWIRMGMISRLPQVILSGENMALNVLTLPEFNNRMGYLPGVDNKMIQLRTPIPTTQDIWISGAMPVNNQIMFIDRTKALIKLNSMALRMENERIVEKQISGTYATLETGFAKLFTDASVMLDQSLAFSSNGFPSYMDYTTYQQGQIIRP